MLLVEDDEYLAEALQTVLREAGYQPTWCADAMQAISHLSAGGLPTFILLDLNTPNMDGWEFRLRQRQQLVWSQIPVIAVSADLSAKAAAIDAHAFLAKPVDASVLLDTIDRVLAERVKAGSSRALPRARNIDVRNALSILTESLGAARSHYRALSGEFSGLVAARARSIGTLLRTADRAAQQLEDLLAREDQRDLTLPDGRVDVARVLRLSLVHAELDMPAATRIVSDIAPDTVAFGDAAKLGRVFLNLLRNAGQAMVDVAQPVLKLEVWPEGHETLSITISDAGCGMLPETLERVFDPFYTSGRRQLAQGLGLTVARRLVLEMGGSLDMRSCPELGSTVRINLQRAAGSVVSSELTPRSRERVLVVDDDLGTLAELEGVLSERFSVTAMRSWQALQHMYAGHRFDLVLYNNARSETRALSFFAALAFKHPEQASRVVCLQNSRIEHRLRRWLEDVGIWQLEEARVDHGLARRLERLLQLWTSIGLRNPHHTSRGTASVHGGDADTPSRPS